MSAAAMTSSPKMSPHSSKPLIRREHRGRVLVPPGHQLKKKHCAGARDREIADLIDDQQRRMREDLQPRLQPSSGLRLFERGDQVSQRAVVDAPASLRCGDRKTDRQMRLTDSGRAEEDDILAALHEAELVEALHLLAAQRGLNGEIEVVELLHHGQPARAHRGLEPSVIPQLNLRGEQLLDRLRRGQRAAIDALENGVERFKACDPQISGTRRSRGVSLEPVFVMETAQDWRGRDSVACWNRAAV